MSIQPDPSDPNKAFRAQLAKEFATGYEWTPEDVEAIAQSMVDDTLPYDLLQKIGPFPPDEFLSLVGKRVEELMRQKAEADHGVG
jgi:hypothetical protein